MTTPEPAWTEFEGAIQRDDPTLPGYLEMHGRVNAVRVTYFPGVALPHIEVWTERPGHPDCGPDAPPAYNHFSAFAPIRQDQTDAEWLEMLRNSVSTLLVPTTEESP